MTLPPPTSPSVRDVRNQDDAVVALCSELIRYDSSITGGLERALAERVAEELSDMGLTPLLLEQHARRSNVVARIEGSDTNAPALLVHIHLDVVPADPASWRLPPYAGEISDGYVWGRGAVDMKDMAAMTLCALRSLLSQGWRPRRDIVFAFVADEELGGGAGAGWLANSRSELFEGCTEAVGEAGGFSHEYRDGRRAYLVQTGEKGVGWLRLLARGASGHGSMHQADNPVARLARALTLLEQHDFGRKSCASTETLTSHAMQWHDCGEVEDALSATGPLATLLLPLVRNTYTPTGLRAGTQQNVVPSVAEALIDGRFVPGHRDSFYKEVAEFLGDLVDIETVFHSEALETEFVGHVPHVITEALKAEDPHALVVPTCLPISTDAKHFAKLGMNCYGFVPLRLPGGFDFPSMFHGTDERVPISALTFGHRVMERFFRSC